VGRYRGLCVTCLTVLLAVALSASGTAAPAMPIAPTPGLPGLPGLPKLPKPDQKAVFDVIVEGKASDHNTSELSGTDAACLVKENGTVDETDTYLRGKDVKLEFDRYGKTIIVKRNRGGQLGDTSLAVKVTVKRTAEGSISYVPTAQALSCPAGSDISKNADCGKDKKPGGQAMLLTWTEGRVGLAVTRGTQSNTTPIDRCGLDAQTGITDALHYAWPFPAKLSAVEALPATEIFNRRIHVVTITMLSSPADERPGHTAPWNASPLTGTVKDSAKNRAIIRFVRVSG
jgi:hypothetical protein